MADYRALGWDGLSNHKDKSRKGYPNSNVKRTTINKEESVRYPTQFEEDVRIVYDELMSVLIKKHNDYGAKNIADAPGGALNGLRVRIHDKTARINNLLDFRRRAEYESLEDSFKDLANYAIIAVLVLRDKWDKEGSSTHHYETSEWENEGGPASDKHSERLKYMEDNGV